VLRQDQFAFDSFRVIDTVIMGNPRLWAALEEREFLYAKASMTDAEGMRLGELEGIVGEGMGTPPRATPPFCCRGSTFRRAAPPEDVRAAGRPEGPRAARAGAVRHPPALLLDEPTNHLDLDSIHWLEDFLVHYDGTLIVISHDRHFLNEVCTHIADIDYQTIITYTGGYDDMVLAKTQIRSRIEPDYAQREKKIAQLNEFIQRFGSGTRASQATSRRKEVERLETTALARSNIQRPYIRFGQNRPSGRTVMEIKDVSKAFSGHTVIPDFTGVINRGEKIVLVGRNGAGKTTMLKTLLADAPNLPESPGDRDGGSVRWGTRSRSAISRPPISSEGLTIAAWLHQFDPDASRQDIHGLLGQMLFSGEEGLKPTEALGGETARVLFCRIMLQKPNLLVLDERRTTSTSSPSTR
jgi:ATPase subunit of ABC transporter with duplicated ATPase domains